MNTLFLIIGLIIAGNSITSAKIITWTGANKTNDWHIPGNWEGFVIPTAMDDVVIKLANLSDIWIDGNETAYALSLSLSSVSLNVFSLFQCGDVLSDGSAITVFTEVPSVFAGVTVDKFVVATSSIATVSTLVSSNVFIFESAILNLKLTSSIEDTVYLSNGKISGPSYTTLYSDLVFVDSMDTPPSSKLNLPQPVPSTSKDAALRQEANKIRDQANVLRKAVTGKSPIVMAITPAYISGVEVETESFTVYVGDYNVVSEVIFMNGGSIHSSPQVK